MTATERRIRIGDWLMPYDDATQEVTVMRSLLDILKATPGSHLDCMNSICIRAQRNVHCFPHPVLIVSTIRTRVYIVDRLDDSGAPAHCVRYQLGEHDRALINAHDRFGEGQPGELRLRIPNDPKGSPRRAAQKSQKGRFGSLAKGERYSGDGQVTRQQRPVTSHSLGAEYRYVTAVGGLRADA